MRLTAREIDAIKAAAREAFGPGAVVRLFGSRVDDSRRGGDIDLHVEVADIGAARAARGRFLSQLYRTVGEREYDVVLCGRDDARSSIDQRAVEQGAVL
jgi:uncharacterized protein